MTSTFQNQPESIAFLHSYSVPPLDYTPTVEQAIQVVKNGPRTEFCHPAYAEVLVYEIERLRAELGCKNPKVPLNAEIKYRGYPADALKGI